MKALLCVCGNMFLLLLVDSFFNKLCSTPARPMDSSLPKYLITHSESDISNSSGVSTSLLQDSVTHCEVRPVLVQYRAEKNVNCISS